MTLEEKFCDVITRTDDERKRLKDILDSAVKQAKHYCEIAKSSEMAFANAKSETYNQQLVIADAAIKQIMKDTPEPEKYDADRVHTLRHILSSGTEATADARYDKMKALCELQAYLKKFPLGVRVAELVREWTGVDDVTVEYTDEFDYVLRVKGTPVMHLYTRPQEIWVDRLRKMSTSNIQISNPMLYMDYDFRVEIGDFWETYCRLTPLSASFIVGSENYDKWKGNNMSVIEYADGVRKLGRNNGCVTHYNISMGNSLNDEDFAAVVIINSTPMLTIGECMRATEHLRPKLSNRLTELLKDFSEYIFRKDLENNPGQVKLNLEQQAILWKTNIDDSLMFDPDTCEMQHPCCVWNKIDVSGYRIRDIHDVVAKNVPWIDPLPTIVYDVYASDELMERIKNGDTNCFVYPLQVGVEIKNVEKVSNDNHYQMTATYKLPADVIEGECTRYGFNYRDKAYILYERISSYDKIAFLSFEKDK